MVERNKVSRIHDSYIEQHDAQMQRQKRRKKKLYRRLILFAFIVVITMVTLTKFHIGQRETYQEMQQEHVELSDKLENLQQKEKSLVEEKELLNDEEYLLQIAKTNYFFTEEGEIVFKLPEEDSSY